MESDDVDLYDIVVALDVLEHILVQNSSIFAG